MRRPIFTAGGARRRDPVGRPAEAERLDRDKAEHAGAPGGADQQPAVSAFIVDDQDRAPSRFAHGGEGALDPRHRGGLAEARRIHLPARREAEQVAGRNSMGRRLSSSLEWVAAPMWGEGG